MNQATLTQVDLDGDGTADDLQLDLGSGNVIELLDFALGSFDETDLIL